MTLTAWDKHRIVTIFGIPYAYYVTNNHIWTKCVFSTTVSDHLPLLLLVCVSNYDVCHSVCLDHFFVLLRSFNSLLFLKMLTVALLALFNVVLETTFAEPPLLKCTTMDCQFNLRVVETFSCWTLSRRVGRRTRVFFDDNQMFYAGAPPNASLPSAPESGRLVSPEEASAVIIADGFYKMVRYGKCKKRFSLFFFIF